MRELILVRHGEPTHPRDGLTGGWTDSGLTELGRAQARATGVRLAELLCGESFGSYSSDLRRARETAELVALGVGSQPEYVAGLREFDNGSAANMAEEDARRIWIPPPPTRQEAYDWAPYPGAETFGQIVVRVSAAMGGIEADGADLVLVVSHGIAGQVVVTWWLGLIDLLRDRAFAFDLDPCSITHLTVNRWEERTISRLNDTAHLAGLSA